MIIGRKPKPTISFAFSLYHNKARLFMAGLLIYFLQGNISAVYRDFSPGVDHSLYRGSP